MNQDPPASPVDGAPGSRPGQVERAFYLMHMSGPVAVPLVRAIEEAFEPDEYAIVDDEGDPQRALSRAELGALEPAARARLRVIVGDFPYGAHAGTPVPLSYLAFLREPLARVVDLHRRFVMLQQRTAGGAPRDGSRRQPMSLERFVFEQRHLAVDNGMVRAIAARWRVRFGQCPEDLLVDARAHIRQHFSGLLLSEDMPASAAILESILGRRLPGLASVDVDEAQVADDGSAGVALDPVEPSLAARIRALNRLDSRLYDEARAALAQTYDRFVRSGSP